MPDIPRYPAFIVTSNLQQELSFNQTAGTGDPLAGTGASIPSSINVQRISQNPNGTWNEVLSDEASPVSSQDSLLSAFSKKRNDTIAAYKDLVSIYDTEMLRFNDQINQKKNQIVSLVQSGITTGCLAKIPTSAGVAATMSVPGADDIGGVAVGIASTVRSDQVSLSIYSNITNYSADSPFNPSTTVGLSTSNLGTGYRNAVSNNSGSVLSETYRFITTVYQDHFTHLTTGITTMGVVFNITPQPAGAATTATFCVGIGTSIISIAAEIDDLRDQRDQFLSQINDLKELKTKQEVLKWGDNQGDASLTQYNTQLQSAITSISQYIDNIVTSDLIVHYDSGQTYGIETSVDSITGINAVSKWNNLVGDGLYANPQTSLYPINLDVADASSAELNNYPTATNQHFTVDSSFIGSGKIGTANTSYAIETWVKVTNDVALGISSTTNGASIVGISSIHGYGLQVYKPSGIRLSFGERGNGRLTNNTNLSTGTWYHVVATNEAGVGSKIYLNGTLDASGSAIDITSSVSKLKIGFGSSVTNHINQYFSGKVAVIRIYKKNLSQSQVTQNYNALKQRFGY